MPSTKNTRPKDLAHDRAPIVSALSTSDLLQASFAIVILADFPRSAPDSIMSQSADPLPRSLARGSVFLAIECPRCEHYSERPLAWLRDAPATICDHCAAAIDLSSGTSRAIIDAHVDLAERLDAEFGGR